MRLTDDRYSTEQTQFQLAFRMIGHEARTHTIRECTGLSDDRIRKIYSTYFSSRAGNSVKRRRGKSPRQVQRFVKTASHCLQATTLLSLFRIGRLISVDADGNISQTWPRPDVEMGHRLCRAYETYTMMHARPLFSFEWAYSLYINACYNDELRLLACRDCSIHFISDAYALNSGFCPGCDHEHGRC